MQKYQNYKTTNIKWIDQIPADWNEIPLRKVFEDVKNSNTNGDNIRMLSLVKDIGIIPYEDRGNQGNKSSDKLEKYKIVEKGDFVINKMNAVLGSLGISEYKGLVSPVYYVLRNRNEDEFISRYFELIFKTRSVQRFLRTMSKGIMEIRESVDWAELKNMSLPLPSTEDQRSIVEYVNRVDKLTRDFIKQKQKYIELLKEYKQSKINELVTKGLDHNVKMKDSGIEWLGQIPEHWEVVRLKIIASINPIIRTKSLHPDLPVVFLPMESVEEDGNYKNEAYKITSEISTGYTYFEKGDIIIAKITPCFENRKGALLDKLKSEYGFGTTELHVVRGKRGANLKYLFYLLRSELFMRLGEMNMKGTAGQKRVPDIFIKTYKLGLPPISEQEKISQKIEEIERSFNEVEKRSRSQMRIIRKYRQSLIYELVTGIRKP